MPSPSLTEPKTGGPVRVAALVQNSVSHDIRVLKEAEALQEAGYDVTIVGVVDRRQSEHDTRLPNGVRILRIDRPGRLRESRMLVSVLGWTGAAGIALLTGLLILIPAVASWLAAFPGRLLLAALFVMLAAIAFVRTAELWLTFRETRRARWTPSSDGDAPAARTPAPQAGNRNDQAIVRTLGLAAKLLRLPIKIAGFSVIRRAMGDALEVLQPDVVHCHDASTLPAGVAYKQRHPDAVVVYDSHELFEETAIMTPVRRAIWRRVQRKGSRVAAGLVTVNDSIGAELKKRYPSFPDPVVVMNATRLPDEPPEDDGRLRQAAKLDEGARILLYQGGFSSHRGLETLVEAAARLPDPWRLVMMGWGGREAELRRIARQVDPNGDRIRFIPGAPQAELRWWTAGGDLGVIPYENTCLNHWFCSPNKLWEYPVAGVPILASAFPVMQSVIERWDIGRLLPDPLTADAIVDVISAISDDELTAMKTNCRTFLENDHWGVYAAKLCDLYRELAPTPARTSTNAASAVAVA